SGKAKYLFRILRRGKYGEAGRKCGEWCRSIGAGEARLPFRARGIPSVGEPQGLSGSDATARHTACAPARDVRLLEMEGSFLSLSRDAEAVEVSRGTDVELAVGEGG